MNNHLVFWYNCAIMTNEAIWLVNLFKKFGYKYLCIKSFYKTLNGRVWDDDDLRGASHVRSYAIIRLSSRNDEYDGFYISAKKNDNMPAALIEIEFPFKHAGNISIPLEKLTNDVFDKLCKSIFIQLMLLVAKGYAINLGMHEEHLIEPYAEIASLIECDMSVE